MSFHLTHKLNFSHLLSILRLKIEARTYFNRHRYSEGWKRSERRLTRQKSDRLRSFPCLNLRKTRRNGRDFLVLRLEMMYSWKLQAARLPKDLPLLLI